MNTPSQHSYGTRTRQNPLIKPTPVPIQRSSPPPLASSPAQWPLPNIVLHADDASNKTFLALARSFSSVDNKAVTIKDLADMIQQHGLACHSASAANQAITTYIRNHLQRCEAQQDTPLLIAHVLSGTHTDDELLPALHSHTGGSSGSPLENRKTNFRKGTMVWYLSRVTGAPCPFARANIRLSEFTDESRLTEPPAVKDKQPREQAGQKRKRPLRGCNKSQSDSESPPPAKVKLTLRLKPLLKKPAVLTAVPVDSSDEAMSLGDPTDDEEDAETSGKKLKEIPWSLPPYPRRSTICIPGYRPSSESVDLLPLEPAYTQRAVTLRHRSPSIGSPPPDSDYEDDDSPITMTGGRRSSSYFDQGDDEDSEPETQWEESPGPRSPSAPVADYTVSIKEEALDSADTKFASWSSLGRGYDAPSLFSPEIDVMGNVKIESLEQWSWDTPHVPKFPEWVSADPSSDFGVIKQEYEEVPLPFTPISPFPSSDFPSASSLSCLIESMSMNSPTTATAPSHSWSASPAAFHFTSTAEKMAQAEREIVVGPSNVSPLLVIQTAAEIENVPPQESFQGQSSLHDATSIEPPLSATEQEMFLALCAGSDYPHCPSTPHQSDNANGEESQRKTDHVPAHDRPLRRSKRVANAIVAAKTPARPPRRAASRKITS